MKKLFFKGIVLVSAVVALVACKKVEPTAVTEDVVGSVTVSGSVTYSPGSGKMYATDKPVFVDVDMTCFDSTFVGVKRYSSTTDASGMFSLSVPCPVGKSVKGKLTVSFDADYTSNSTSYIGHYESTVDVEGIDGGTFFHEFENLTPKSKRKK